MNTHDTTPSKRRLSPTLRSISVLIAAASFACEVEPVADPIAEVTGEIAPQPGANELSSADIESTHEFAAQADAVFVGEVTAISHQMSDLDDDGQQLPFTIVTWQVEDGIKGVDASSSYSARFLGGPVPDGKVLSVSEIPQFELGDRDLLFVEHNGEVGCPLVGGAKGRVQLLRAGQTGDGVSRVAPGPDWSTAVADSIRDAGLDEGEPAEALALDEPFVFPQPQIATREELEAMHARSVAARTERQAPTHETEAERAERAALEANDFNPVLPRE